MEYIRVTKENIENEHICCAISSNKDIQVISKKNWLKERFDDGLVFLKSIERGKCFIEYIPAENAWNPINADGYMYIDCLWVAGSFKGNGYSNDLLNACIEDSKEKEKKGICILSATKKKPFLADPKFLKYKEFTVCDEADNGIQLWYLPFLWMRLSLNLRSVRSIHTLSRQAMYCTIPINVRLMQSMFRCFLKLPGKEGFRFRQPDWKRKKKHRMLRHRLQPMHCFIMENILRMSR